MRARAHTHTHAHTQNQKGRSIRQVRKKKGSYQCHLSQGVTPQCSKCQVDQSLQTSLLISEISIFYCCNNGLGCRTIHQSQTQQKDNACLHSDEFHPHSFYRSLGVASRFFKEIHCLHDTVYMCYMTAYSCLCEILLSWLLYNLQIPWRAWAHFLLHLL